METRCQLLQATGSSLRPFSQAPQQEDSQQNFKIHQPTAAVNSNHIMVLERRASLNNPEAVSHLQSRARLNQPASALAGVNLSSTHWYQNQPQQQPAQSCQSNLQQLKQENYLSAQVFNYAPQANNYSACGELTPNVYYEDKVPHYYQPAQQHSFESHQAYGYSQGAQSRASQWSYCPNSAVTYSSGSAGNRQSTPSSFDYNHLSYANYYNHQQEVVSSQVQQQENVHERLLYGQQATQVDGYGAGLEAQYSRAGSFGAETAQPASSNADYRVWHSSGSLRHSQQTWQVESQSAGESWEVGLVNGDIQQSPRSRKELSATKSEPAGFSETLAGASAKQLEQQVGAPNKTNQCNVCGRLYARPSTLKTHLRTHTNERPFKCSVCSKTFSQAANLTAHQRVHTGERPFSCPICNRQFSQSSSVITHLRTHSGERPYRCAMCSRTFSDSSTLTKHCRIHSGEKPYQCDYCPLNFSQSGNLSRHLKLHLITSNNNSGASSATSGGSSSSIGSGGIAGEAAGRGAVGQTATHFSARSNTTNDIKPAGGPSGAASLLLISSSAIDTRQSPHFQGSKISSPSLNSLSSSYSLSSASSSSSSPMT